MALSGLFSRRNGPEYHKVDGSGDPEAGRTLIGSVPRFSRKVYLGLLGGFLFLLLIAAAGHSQLRTTDDTTPNTPSVQPGTSSPGKSSPIPEASSPGVTRRKLRVIAPADKPGTNLCKTLLSGYANGYPASVIVNWERDFSLSHDGFNSSHLAKIDGVLDGLEGMTDPRMPREERLSDDDLVFILDAYDVWLQLPAETLIQRYYASLARADKRVAAAWHAQAPGAAPPPTHDVLIASQKKCWPTERDGHATKCDILPESDLRADLYGPETDKDYKHHLHDIRPRYINSGSIMGTVGGMKRFFASSKEIVVAAAAAGTDYTSDQGVLGAVLGAQEAWRKQEREINARAAKGEDVSGAAREWNATAEHGLGLDYRQDLFKPTVFEEDDGLYMALGDEDNVRNASATAGVDPPRIAGLPLDLRGIPSPLTYAGVLDARGPDGDGDEDDPSWAEIPLYTDFWSEVVTVAVHHNAHRGGMKGRRLKEWWNHNWFFPYLREIADLSVQARPLRAITQVNAGGRKLEFWAPAADAKKPMPRIFDKGSVEKGMRQADWSSLCAGKNEKEWWDVVFQDGRGWSK